MEMSPVLSPTGEPIFTAGGNAAWKVGTYRGWVVSLEWAKRGRKYINLMVIWPESNILTAGSVASGMWAISRQALTDFVAFNADDKCTGYPSKLCESEAKEALPLLGKDRNDVYALRSLMDAVVHFADDLVRMPVAPPRVKDALTGAATWQVSATNKSTGRTLSEAEV